MKTCSLDHFTESLKPWLDSNYIQKVSLHSKGQVTFTFQDGIRDTYQITDCNNQQVRTVCRELAGNGIMVEELA